MTSPDYRAFISSCLHEAACLARRLTGHGVAEVKADDANQVVTSADLAIGRHLVDRIHTGFPRDGILEEESGPSHGDSEVTWIVDPLDGTSNYAAGSPLYGVIIAAVDTHGALAGGIALPAFDEVYLAVRGQGAQLNGRPLPALPRTLPQRTLFAHGLDTGPAEVLAAEGQLVSALAATAQGVRMSNSIFDVCQVIRGVYGSFTHRNCRIWDIAAALCLIGEVGGVATDLDGHPLDVTRPMDQAERTFAVCLASTTAHAAVMSAVARARLTDPALCSGSES